MTCEEINKVHEGVLYVKSPSGYFYNTFMHSIRQFLDYLNVSDKFMDSKEFYFK